MTVFSYPSVFEYNDSLPIAVFRYPAIEFEFEYSAPLPIAIFPSTFPPPRHTMTPLIVASALVERVPEIVRVSVGEFVPIPSLPVALSQKSCED